MKSLYLYIFLALFVVIVTTGCAGNHVKVLKYDASGRFNPFIPASMDGCFVSTSGELEGITVEYDSDTCIVKVNGSTDDPIEEPVE